MKKTQFQTQLLNWYKSNKRILPWRNNVTPYRVWISEIMLQQTRVETVIPFFNKFISVLPTIKDVSLASEDTLNKLWEGLGYYSRVRNIKKAAIKINSDFGGVFPEDYDDIISLPGIGPYTAGAISSIAFNNSYTAVDGNVLRVFSRLLGIKENIKDPKTKQVIKEAVKKLLPKDVSSFNQGLMEIGATICKPNGAPNCIECPLNNQCIAYKKNLTDSIPFIIRKTKKRNELKTVTVLKYKNLYALEKRPSKGLLAGLYQFPLHDGNLSKNEIDKIFESSMVQSFLLDDSTHLFSHIKWFMKGYLIEVKEMSNIYDWVNIDDIKQSYSIPTAFKCYKNFIGL